MISFYQSTDTIVIMRYNGEVYQLFTFTEADNEEEEDLNSEFINACSTQSTYSSYQPIRDSKKKQRSCENSLKKTSTTRSVGGLDSIIRPSMFSVDSKKSQSSKNQLGVREKASCLRNNRLQHCSKASSSN